MTVEKYVIEALDGERESLTSMFDTIEEARFHFEEGTAIVMYTFEFSDSEIAETWPREEEEDEEDEAS